MGMTTRADFPMSHLRAAIRKFSSKLLFCFATMCLLFSVAGSAAYAQTAESLSNVKKVYIDSFGHDDAANTLRERMIKQLRKTGRLEIVNTPNAADALIKGSDSIWVVGYVSTNPRAPSSARQPVFQGF